MKRRGPAIRWPGAVIVFVGLGTLIGVGSLVFSHRSTRQSAASRLPAFIRQSAAQCQSHSSAVWETPFCWPNEASDCQALGGLWGQLGATSGYGCNFVAPDSGQPCADRSDCSSQRCLAILSPEVRQQLRETDGQRIRASGVCAGLLRVRGCNADVAGGTIREIRCQQ